jgi:hypothetical protein
VLIAAALQVLAVVWLPLRDLLRTDTLPVADALLVLALSLAPGLVLGGWQRVVRRRIEDEALEGEALEVSARRDSASVR